MTRPRRDRARRLRKRHCSPARLTFSIYLSAQPLCSCAEPAAAVVGEQFPMVVGPLRRPAPACTAMCLTLPELRWLIVRHTFSRNICSSWPAGCAFSACPGPNHQISSRHDLSGPGAISRDLLARMSPRGPCWGSPFSPDTTNDGLNVIMTGTPGMFAEEVENCYEISHVHENGDKPLVHVGWV